METIRLSYPDGLPSSGEPVSLAIGFFDGVHRGHQAVIAEAIRLGEELGAVPAVMTFDPHPRQVLGKEQIHRFLTPLPEKLGQFRRLGVKRAYVMRFDPVLAGLDKKRFVDGVLVPLGVRAVVTGFNFAFGRGAEGKAADLPELAEGRFVTRVIAPIESGGVPVSSTRLRKALSEGDMEIARDILGRFYSLEGTVVPGDRRGRQLGFPTANLEPDEPYLLPKRGVYVVRVTDADGLAEHGVMNIGIRPTIHDPEPKERLEVHVLGFSGDLYGRVLRVEFLHFLREERKFSSLEELAEQIRRDRDQAESWLARVE
ncbi:bifunctional riboflavin kinase/FAD synthetase [Staphylospora marina]|uniref:bifunctional riboflavin kinase/FAD synthetase n=1 Tax=Staphylospora marina TaxID=2490858 RepID=UPI0013DE1BAD|nr:bifunctional riboflavin kinase/FAD synthetase [Staphylospora marina]